MFCIKCGKEIEADAKFCMFCGAEVSVIENMNKNNKTSKEHESFNSDGHDELKEIEEKTSLSKIVIVALAILVIILFVILISPKKNEDVTNGNLPNESSESSSSDKANEEETSNFIQQEKHVDPNAEWVVAENHEELLRVVERFPGDDHYYINPLFKYTWSYANILTLGYDATPMFQRFFGSFDVFDYANEKNAPYFSNIELYDAVGNFVTSGYCIRAEDVEKRLENAAKRVFGIDRDILRESSFYIEEYDAYIYQTEAHGIDDSIYGIEKIILFDNYAFAYRRLYSSYNPETKKQENSIKARKNGCVNVLYRNEDDDNYHYVSNFAVKDIDKVLENTFYRYTDSQEPDYYGERYISFVTAGSGLRIRTGPGENYDSIITIPLDAPVLCLAEQNGWIYVRFNDVYGWMSKEYLRKQ